MLAGATVTVRELNTGFERVIVTDPNGRYTAVLLPVGDYLVRVELNGFAQAQGAVRLGLGQLLTVNFDMRMRSPAEFVDVPGRTSAGSAASLLVEEHTIADLPLNGRDYRDFALLAPTAQSTAGARGTFRLGGQPGDYLALLVDGADFTNNFFGEFFGSLEARHFTIPLEAVQEFQVVAGELGAEFGRSNGGLVSVITRSGTNRLRGSGAYFLRHNKLTAADAFGNPPTGLVRHQFGGSLGGPISADRTFYFFAADIQNQETPITVKFARDVRGIGAPELGISDLSSLEGQYPRNEDITTFLAKLDHDVSGNHRLTTRLNYTRSQASNMGGGGLILSRALSNLESVTNAGIAAVSSVSSSLGSRLFLESKFQLSREDRPRRPQGPGPQVQIVDTGTFGGSSSLPATQDMYRYQLSENANYLAGRHTLKLGADYNAFNMRNNFFAPSLNGAYLFPSLEAFLARAPTSYSQNFGLGGYSAKQAGLLRSYWQHELALYIHDQYRPASGVTIGAGLRYDAQFNPTPLAGIAGVRVPVGAPRWTGTQYEVDFAPVPQDIPDDTNNVAPRIDATYDLRGDGRVLIKGAIGYYYGRTPMIYFPVRGSGTSNTTIFNSPASFGVRFPEVLPSAIEPGSQLANLISVPAIQYVDPDFQNPRVLNVSASVTRRLPGGWDAGAGYLFSDSRNLRMGGFRSTFWDRNLAPTGTVDRFGRTLGISSVGSARPDTTIATANAMASLGKARYHALILEAKRPLAQGWQFYASYTLSSSKGNASTERDTEALFGPSDPFNLDLDYGRNELDVRHGFKSYVSAALPWGISLASTWTATSGLAFPVYSALDLNGDNVRNGGFNPDRPVVDGRLLPRFPFHQPATFMWDFRAARHLRFGARAEYHLIIEVFNLLNTDNLFSDPRTNAVLGAANFRRLNRTVGPRIAQIGARVEF